MPTLPSRFQLKHELGRGGMGTVYRAYDRVAGHDVALKVLRGMPVEGRLHLKSEFRALANVVHPNFVNLYELVIEEDSCFYTMELVHGADFSGYVAAQRERDANGTWLVRVRDAARQLALALNALHESGKLHRDVKPSNVLVTDAGRVVLLDFGLAVSTVDSEAEELVGTPVYMSPEQLWGRPLSPASDWYSFAVTLHEAVSGQIVTRADLLSIQASRTQPNAAADAVDPELESLILGLLDPEPERRPSSSRILECLGEISRDAGRVSLPPSSTPRLIGREDALLELRRVLDDPAGPVVLRVPGQSGVGKSSLLRVFLDDVDRNPDVVVLRSRCHPQETVVFNAVDGFVDDLGREVRERLPPQDRSLSPAQHAALSQVFPVLARALDSDWDASTPASDNDRRLLAFDALREILNRLAQRCRLVAWLDDAQWGDRDSGILLRHLLTANGAPCPIRLVMSYRAEDEGHSPCLRALREDNEFWQRTQQLPLAALDAQQSGALMEALLGADWQGDQRVREQLLRASAGSPFLLNESARYLAAHDATQPSAVSLDDILRVRTNNLPADSRTLLEVLAVAGAPIEQWTALAAAALDRDRRGLLADLERLCIVRTTDVHTRRVEFYHDKLREEVLRQLGDEVRNSRHGALGRALLSGSSPNPLSAFEHFEAAGDVEAMRRYVLTAANHALKLLAFERAARLYQRAIQLRPGEVELHELYRRLGTSFAGAGHGSDAARAYSEAAEHLKQSDGVSAEQIVNLHRLAAEQFIQVGQYQDGLLILRRVLTEFGVQFPASRGEALKRATGLRLLSLVQGYRARASSSPGSELELRRFDALWSVTTRLSMVDYALCSYAAARCAREAVRLNEPSRLSRALSMEASFSSLIPYAVFQRRALALLEQAERHARHETASPHDAIFTESARAVISFYRGEFRSTWQRSDAALARLRAELPGRQWEDAPAQLWSLLGLAMNGELKELIRRVLEARADAARRNDRYVEQGISLGVPTVAWLARGDIDEARRRADVALSWAPQSYTAQHYQHYVSHVDYDLYSGDSLSPWRRTADTWETHRRENFLMLTFIRDDLLRARGRAALSAAIELRRARGKRLPSGETMAQLLTTTSRAARALTQHRTSFSTGVGLLLEAGLSMFQGEQPKAERQLEQALAVFDRGDLRVFREVTRFGLGRVRGLCAARVRDAAEAWLREQGVVDPLQFARTLAPGVV